MKNLKGIQDQDPLLYFFFTKGEKKKTFNGKKKEKKEGIYFCCLFFFLLSRSIGEDSFMITLSPNPSFFFFSLRYSMNLGAVSKQ